MDLRSAQGWLILEGIRLIACHSNGTYRVSNADGVAVTISRRELMELVEEIKVMHGK